MSEFHESGLRYESLTLLIRILYIEIISMELFPLIVLFYTIQIKPTRNNYVHFIQEKISYLFRNTLFQDDDLNVKLCFCESISENIPLKFH